MNESPSVDKAMTLEIVLNDLNEQIIRANKLVFGDIPREEEKVEKLPQPASKTLRYIDSVRKMIRDLQEVNRQLESL